MILHVDEVLGHRAVDIVLRDAASSNVVRVSSDWNGDGDQLVEQVSKL